MMDLTPAKQAAAEAAIELVEPQMVIGLGSGSTSHFFMEALSIRCQKGLLIRAVPSSNATALLAKKLKIPLLDINDAPKIDLTIDGADEIDPQFRMIKGGGGAHVREKILASSSDRICIIADHTKLVDHLGKRVLPLEIIPYGSFATAQKIEQIGYTGAWRRQKDGSFFLTDNGNFIYDIEFENLLKNPEEIDQKLKTISGIVDTGFFFHLVDLLIVGYPDGNTETRFHTGW